MGLSINDLGVRWFFFGRVVRLSPQVNCGGCLGLFGKHILQNNARTFVHFWKRPWKMFTPGTTHLKRGQRSTPPRVGCSDCGLIWCANSMDPPFKMMTCTWNSNIRVRSAGWKGRIHKIRNAKNHHFWPSQTPLPYRNAKALRFLRTSDSPLS